MYKGDFMMTYLQRIGRALMVPVAVLPAAAILCGVGYAFLSGEPSGFMESVATILVKAGGAILDSLGVLFAVGIAYGLSRDKDGAAALAGLVGFLVVTTLLATSNVAVIIGQPEETLSIAFGKSDNAFIGICVGIIASITYNRFSRVELPAFLAFFSGRRLVPILVAAFMIPFSLVMIII